ncbi:MAG: threonine synthase [Acidobacteria bacterium]|nr:threonine synthase [Acidobacteriota bacterium]MBV9147419.1 threonine synthase [Acidobacteriota bacterium]
MPLSAVSADSKPGSGSAIAYFECSKCGEHLPADKPQTLCPKDAGSLWVRYDLRAVRARTSRDDIAPRAGSMWRYRELLPNATPVTLGEGFTPMLPSRRHKNLWLKDEGANPTGSFKARGLCMAVTMARHYGLKKLAIPSAGNAAGALAAYAAAAGIESHIFMPKDVPEANLVECTAYGAHVTLVNGLISDCARMLGERKQAEGWFDVSTLKEPFRVEGKKTMGLEVAEQVGWRLPDAIFYPTGGGVGLIGMWKAFDELEQLGWLESGSKRPKMIAVQAAGCAPIPKAFEEGKSVSEAWQDASTFASGLRVPKAYGDYLILDFVRRSGGTAIAISDQEMLASLLDWAREEGVFLCPEGAAATAAYDKLLATGFLKASDEVVIFNTGTGLKYIDVLGRAIGIRRDGSGSADGKPAERKIGGIIGPY